MKIFNKEAQEQLQEGLKTFSDFCLKNINEKNGTFEVIGSTNDVDRHGEVVDQNGWDLKNFFKNPVILWAHNSWSELPIGKATDITFEDGNKMIIKGVFASEKGNPKAQQVRNLHDEGILKAVSVGFIVKKRDEHNSRLILEAELLELSFVPIPANPEALSRLKEAGVKSVSMDLLDTEKKQIDKDEGKKDNKDTEEDKDDKDKVDQAEVNADVAKTLSDVVESLKEIKEKSKEVEKKDKYEVGSEGFKIKLGVQNIAKLSQTIIENMKSRG